MPDADAAGRLYDRFGASLYRYALMLLADHAAAEDVVQQVFAAVVARRVEPSEPEHYLRRAVRNGCYSALRGRRDRLAHRVDALPLLERLPGVAPVEEDVRLALGAAIARLPPAQREVLHLHVFEGHTFREISDITGDTANTIASRYRYAIEKLRAALA